jgi:outer membrane lipoprotein-sorting protein
MFEDESEFRKIINRMNIDTEPNQKHRDDLRAQMLRVFNEPKQQSQKTKTPFSVLRRLIMKSPVTKIAAAAAIIIAVFIGAYYFGDSVNIAGTAYAQVVERLQNARTLTYTVQSNSGIEWMPSMIMEIAFKEPGYMRMSTPDGYLSIIDSIQGKGLTILPPKKQFIEMEISNLQNNPAQQNINLIEKLRSLPERADEQLGTREVNGKKVQGFRVTEEGLINTVWIDLQTRELVLVEMEFLNAPGMSGTMSNFQFDVELDDSLFNLTPPDGYTRLDIQVDTDEVSEQNLIEFLTLWTTWVKDGSFPPTLDPTKLANCSMEMAAKGQFVDDDRISEQDQHEKVLKMTRGLMFLLKMPPDSNWHYAGEGVKLGDAQTAIFWYRPQGSENYRVIYGDLGVKEVAQENLPK